MKSIALRVAVLLAPTFGSTACYPFDTKLVASCEASLKQTLLSPSTYRRVSITETKKPLTFEEYYAANPGEASQVVRDFQRSMAKQPPVRHIAVLEYDASNPYGVPIRSLSECTYDDLYGGDGSNASEFQVRINGKTTTERLSDVATGLAARSRSNKMKRLETDH